MVLASDTRANNEVGWWLVADDSTFIVICKANPAEGAPELRYELATRRVFATKVEGENYAKGINVGREPLVVAGDWRALRFAGPTFDHDCEQCTFLGWIDEGPDNSHRGGCDLYYCGKGHPTVIARYSSDGSDYVSGLASAGAIPVLGIARQRAINRGLLKAEESR